MSDIQESKRYTAGIAVMNAGKALANANAEDILERLETESAYNIAKSLGINRNALYAWLLRNCPEQWQSLSTAVQLGKLSDAQERLDTDDSLDSVGTSRIRESAKIAMWQLSKTSKLYADKQDANSGINIQVVISNPLDQAHVVVDNPLNTLTINPPGSE
jgi:hypothetical protein